MRGLLVDDRFAPITESIGFIRVLRASVADELVDWRREIYALLM